MFVEFFSVSYNLFSPFYRFFFMFNHHPVFSMLFVYVFAKKKSVNE